jgi:hypothetical protein
LASINSALARHNSNTTEETMRTQDSTRARPKPDLEARYGKIGISAVAAAVRYQTAPENPDPAKSTDEAKQLSHEAA